MQYQVTTWYKNKRINLEAITDAQLASMADDMLAIDRHNQELYAEAVKQRGQMLASAQVIWGKNSKEVKYILKADVPTPPALKKEFGKFKAAIEQARVDVFRRGKKRDYDRAYRERKRVEAQLAEATREVTP